MFKESLRLYGVCLAGGITLAVIAKLSAWQTAGWKMFTAGYIAALVLHELIYFLCAKSFIEKFYNDLYATLEAEVGHGGGILKIFYHVSTWFSWMCGAGAPYVAIYGLRAFARNAPLEVVCTYGLFASLAVGVTAHMRCIRFLSLKSLRKSSGELLSASERDALANRGRLGRYAHLSASLAILLLYMLTPSSLVTLPILPAWFHYGINKGYGSLYLAMVDWLLGVKRTDSQTAIINRPASPDANP